MTDLVNIYEKRVLTNIRLTQHQMEILAMVAASPEGIVPDEDISKDRNYTAARQLLTKLGLLTNNGEDEYSISETGQKVAQDENIVDETGQLTELGNNLAFKDDEGGAPPPPEAGPSDEPAPDAFADTAGPAADIPAESYKFGFIGSLLIETNVKLDTLSGEDKTKVLDFADKQGIKVLKSTGPVVELDLNRNSMAASTFISHIRRTAQFDDVSS